MLVYTMQSHVGPDIKIINNKDHRIVKSRDYNYIFNKVDGHFCRWGSIADENPFMAPNPEIADIAISSICYQGCSFCYRGNTPHGKIMSIPMFKKVLKILNNGILNQVALSIGSITAIPNLIDYFKICRDNDLVPNITFASTDPGLTDEFMIEASKYLGACAISNYDIEKTKSVVTRFRTHLDQVNVHQFISMESYDSALQCITDIGDIANAIVFLWVKPKGRAENHFHPITQPMLSNLITVATDKSVSIGFDTCGSVGAISHYQSTGEYEKYKSCIERCCSTRFSIFCDESGNFYPCSFTTGFDSIQPISIHNVTTIHDIWYSDTFRRFRIILRDNGCECPTYDLMHGTVVS